MNEFIALLFTTISVMGTIIFALMFLLVYICTKHRRRKEATCDTCSKRETCEILKETKGLLEFYENKGMKLQSCSGWKKGKRHENARTNQRK